jgi:hypothetical protein
VSTIVQDLRDLANFLEDRPEIAELCSDTNVNGWVYSREAMALAARAFGKADKVIVGDYWMCLRRVFGTITLGINVPRQEVCRKVVTGTRVVPATILPAREKTFVPETVEEIFEWKCDPILGEQPAKTAVRP